MNTRRAQSASGAAVYGCVLLACGGLTGSSSHVVSTPDGGVVSATDAAPADAGGDAESGDAAFCVTIDPSTYDTSCQLDTDCINVTLGPICAGYNCTCGGAAINADGQARYDAVIASVPPGPGPRCQCPYFGRPRCVHAQCLYCPSSIGPMPAPPGCPDGG